MWSQPVKTTPAAEACEAVFFLDDVQVARVAVAAGAVAAYTYQIPADGDYALTVKPVDAAGNVGQPSIALMVHLDHLAPAAYGQLIVTSTAAWTP